MKKLTVIIPAYNNPEELRMTVDSILGSDFPIEELEILLCDDGSSPSLQGVAEEYAGRADVRHFWQEDQGFRPGTARNMGIRAAQGELCLFLDSGVIVTSGCLREHWRLYREHGPKMVAIGYVYGNDLHSDLEEMRGIIRSHSPDQAAAVMEARGMLEGRERDYAQCGDVLWRWQAPWIELWSLHFSAPTAFMRENGVYFDEFFRTWGCEDNDFGIQLHSRGGKFVLGRDARAIHYPARVRSYDRLQNDPEFRAGWLKNKEYLRKKYPDHPLVQMWLTEGGGAVKKLPLLEEAAE
ncbi:glycosyltransferase family 2 protein [Acutalibacter sp. 1XD8-33]|uniref:glycosyltransferase family 2 protein n=1 Tax=Acutalibacter sp. 1XD8-33 TaxID=2320081 RepID=UPI001314316D|nr:glycosyltransferase family 2 protein [Acutalibacter sp. 1XD8-33]